MNNHFYQNNANYQGSMYQNPYYVNNGFTNPSTSTGCSRCENLKLATIYVKPQVYNGISSPADALKQGTAFKELYRPFVGKGGKRS